MLAAVCPTCPELAVTLFTGLIPLVSLEYDMKTFDPVGLGTELAKSQTHWLVSLMTLSPCGLLLVFHAGFLLELELINHLGGTHLVQWRLKTNKQSKTVIM